jgi:MoxR-like ATPase
VRPLLSRVLRTLASNGVQFSDRRAVKAQKLIAASALLAGRREAVREDVGVLAYLWTQDGDDKSIREVLTHEEVPIELTRHERRESSTIILELRELTDGTRGTTEAERRALVQRLHALRQEAQDDHPDDASLVDQIGQAYSMALAALGSEQEGAVGHV